MVGLVKLIGVAVFAMGVIFLMKPDQIKKWLKFWMEADHLYMGSLLSILIGIVFLIAAVRCNIAWVVIVFGIISLIKGLLLFIIGRSKITAKAEEFIKKPAKSLRGFAVLACVFGIVLILAA